jgi:hypothetical protein
LTDAIKELDEDTKNHAKIMLTDVSARRDSIKGIMQEEEDKYKSSSQRDNDFGINGGEGYGYWDHVKAPFATQDGEYNSNMKLGSSIGMGIGTVAGAGFMSTATGMALGAKVFGSLGSAAGPVGAIVGILVGAAAGALIGGAISHFTHEANMDAIEKTVRTMHNEGKSKSDIEAEIFSEYEGKYSKEDLH